VATIASAGNQRLSRVTTFTTVRPTALAFPSVVPLNGETVGVGMVIRVLFDHPVRDHAAAERVMSVTSSKPAVGAFHWFGDYEVHYRPRTYWPAYSKVTLHIGIGGRPLGNGVFGERSRTITFHTGAAMITRVSNATKQLTTTVNGRQVMSAPVSLGKPSTPSSSGTLLVMTIEHNHVMDSSTYGVPADAPGGYRTTVEWALRVTNGGEFLHSAPWSVNQQGRFNVSHGCINIRTAVAKWFYDNSHRGDVVVVTGTERAVQPGDGWTDWRFGWSEWKAGSALA
jgi:lipoprotein-anchoring transpeptidase ErfK/SrfK